MQDIKCVYSKCVGLFYAVNKENRENKRINMHKGDKKEKEGVDGLKKNC